ncbi:hypothetical protein DE146DRAFT_783151 [Phaeosphaeria sp. MPI-PUGE-AT-0046c]|nr:hypothetical protein DE146DRAFT_783151 [Phaeosphaeria sp. MPI-PUGE-AT-0046c]
MSVTQASHPHPAPNITRIAALKKQCTRNKEWAKVVRNPTYNVITMRSNTDLSSSHVYNESSNSLNMASTTAARGTVAIPRLQQASDGASRTRGKRRVGRACIAVSPQSLSNFSDIVAGPQKPNAAAPSQPVSDVSRPARLTQRCNQMAELLESLYIFATDQQMLQIQEILGAIEEDDLRARRHTAPSSSVIEQTMISSLETLPLGVNLDEPSSGLQGPAVAGSTYGIVVPDAFNHKSVLTTRHSWAPSATEGSEDY